MADAPLFYASVTPLNRERHRRLKLTTPGRPFGFAGAAHMIPALLDEFGAAARHLPIVFLPGAKQPTPVFLMGLRPGRNDFVAEGGEWQGQYIPAFVRRFPFILGEVEGSEPLVCIDETSERLSNDAGESLFTEDGADTPLLAERMKFTTDYYAAAKRTEAFSEKLRSLDLLQPITIEATPVGGQGAVLHGLLTVSEPKLAALPDERFLELRRSGLLGPLYAHLLSLSAVAALKAPSETAKA